MWLSLRWYSPGVTSSMRQILKKFWSQPGWYYDTHNFVIKKKSKEESQTPLKLGGREVHQRLFHILPPPMPWLQLLRSPSSFPGLNWCAWSLGYLHSCHRPSARAAVIKTVRNEPGTLCPWTSWLFCVHDTPYVQGVEITCSEHKILLAALGTRDQHFMVKLRFSGRGWEATMTSWVSWHSCPWNQQKLNHVQAAAEMGGKY